MWLNWELMSMDEGLSLIEMAELRNRTPEQEKEEWLAYIEAYILKSLGKLSNEEKAFLAGRGDLQEFFDSQSGAVKKAVNICISSEGRGMDELLSTLERCELD